MTDSLQLIGIGVLILLGYSIISDPNFWITTTRKKYTQFTFTANDLLMTEHTKPQALPSFIRHIGALRELPLFPWRAVTRGKIPKLKSDKYPDIYTSIVRRRFHVKSPYLISGDHFSSFYPRNLGFFYSKALDPATSIDLRDYQDRLTMYLRSLTFGLDFFEQNELTTTVQPIFRHYFFGQKIYSKPADTLCSLLLAFDFLIHPHDHNFVAHKSAWKHAQKLAKREALELLKRYRHVLRMRALEILPLFNSNLGIIDIQHSLSGIRDCITRRSSFYENVAMWKTLVLSLRYHILDEADLDKHHHPRRLKERILELFLHNTLIYNDLQEAEELLDNASADFLVAYSLGFLSVKKKAERTILYNMVQWFSHEDLISDIGIFYSRKNPKRMNVATFVAAPDYMGRTVWSHWTTEFCSLLLDLAAFRENRNLADTANHILVSMMKKIRKYKGYPELYDQKGKLYETWLYASLVKTGWIVNYEYVRQKNRAFHLKHKLDIELPEEVHSPQSSD